MFSVKWGAIPAGAAFVLAFLLSLTFGRADLGVALLRALIFGMVFFGIGCGARALIVSFVPELLNLEPAANDGDGVFQGFSGDAPAENAGGTLGANVSITLGDSQDSDDSGLLAATPSDPYGIDGIGNIAELVSGAAEPKLETTAESKLESESESETGDIDQTSASGYTSELGDVAFSSGDTEVAPAASAADAGGLGNFSSFLNGLSARGLGETDDSLSDLFQTLSSDGRSEASGPSFDEPARTERRSAGSQAADLKGDFSPKEIAMGIRTALAKEKKDS